MYWRAIAVCSSFGGLVAMVAARNSEGGQSNLTFSTHFAATLCELLADLHGD